MNQDAASRDEEKKRNDFKAGRQVGISGREMFSFNPELAAEGDIEDGDEAFDVYQREEEEESVEYKELELDLIGLDAQEVNLNAQTRMFLFNNSLVVLLVFL